MVNFEKNLLKCDIVPLDSAKLCKEMITSEKNMLYFHIVPQQNNEPTRRPSNKITAAKMSHATVESNLLLYTKIEYYFSNAYIAIIS